MTKVTIIGEGQKATTKKPIVFCFYLDSERSIVEFDHAHGRPKEWGNIELISENYDGTFDLMFAYDDYDSRSQGTLYLGHFNDGFVS